MARFWFLFRRFIWRSLLQNKLRSTLTVLGITLGVAILLAINLANHTSLERFKQSVAVVSGQTNLEVQPLTAFSMDEDFLQTLDWVWDWGGQFTPVIVQAAVPADERKEIIQVMGVDMLADFGFRPFQWQPETPSTPSGAPQDTLAIFKPNAVYISAPFAAQNKLKVGDAFPLIINDKLQTLTVAGVMASGGLSSAYDGNLVMMDIANAQTLYDLTGRINRVDLMLPKDKVDAAKALLSKDLPPDLDVNPPAHRGDQVDKMVRAFQLNLMALSFIALLVAMFLIYNTMSISVIRRRPEIGTLRALGTPKRIIFMLFGLEALVQGIIGSVLGAGFGVFLATQAIKGVSATVETLYTGMPAAGVEVSWPILLEAVALGIGLTVLAALPPMLEAANVQPAEATRRASLETRIQSISGKLPLVSLLLWLVAAWCAQQPPLDGFPVFGHAASLLTVLGVALVMPWFLKAMLGLLKPTLHALFGAEGRLAAETLLGSLGRTSVAVASLMVAIAMTVSLAVMIGSFRDTVKVWVGQSITADIWIEPLWQQLNKTRRIQRAVSQAIKTVPGVEVVDDFLEFRIEYNGIPANIAVGEFDVFARKGNLIFLSGESTATVMKRAMKNGSVIVTEAFAFRHHLKTGDTVTLKSPKGPLTLPIEGIYYDYASEHGFIVMDRALYLQHYNDADTLTGIAVYVKPEANTEQVRQAIVEKLGNVTRLNIMTRNGLRAEVLKIFDRTFAITYALHVISITVALLGIMNALFTLVLEARREFGILKYLGATAHQIRKIVLIEAGLLGLGGNIAGLTVGFALSFLLIHVINKQSFGWTIQFALPIDFLIQTFVLIMVTAIISGLLPAKMASKTVAPQVLREE